MAISHAILAALADTACSGYDLSKKFAGSVGFFWHATQQQVYRELSKLEEQGYITGEVIHQEGRPAKKILTITETGKDYLRQWIAKPCEVTHSKDELLVKIFTGYLVPKEIIIKELENHHLQHQETLNTYLEIEKKYFNGGKQLSQEQKYQYITLRNGIRFEKEWIAWCDEAIELLGGTDKSGAKLLIP
jgi:DNA-binding PadR family transcriptional regulator